jgi:hypothetical protein
MGTMGIAWGDPIESLAFSFGRYQLSPFDSKPVGMNEKSWLGVCERDVFKLRDVVVVGIPHSWNSIDQDIRRFHSIGNP